MLATTIDERNCALRVMWNGSRGYAVGLTRSRRNAMVKVARALPGGLGWRCVCLFSRRVVSPSNPRKFSSASKVGVDS